MIVLLTIWEFISFFDNQPQDDILKTFHALKQVEIGIFVA